MAYTFSPLDKKIQEIHERLLREFSSVRTGRATPAILDGITVESYGTRMHLPQLATISIEDPRTIRISPWDAKQGKEIEKAIIASNLGLSVGADEKGIRVFFPELTGERRISLIKLAKEKLEEARTSLRSARDEVWSDIQEKTRDGEMSEDDKFRSKDEMQKHIDEANKAFDDAFQRKEKEIER